MLVGSTVLLVWSKTFTHCSRYFCKPTITILKERHRKIKVKLKKDIVMDDSFSLMIGQRVWLILRYIQIEKQSITTLEGPLSQRLKDLAS